MFASFNLCKSIYLPLFITLTLGRGWHETSVLIWLTCFTLHKLASIIGRCQFCEWKLKRDVRVLLLGQNWLAHQCPVNKLRRAQLRMVWQAVIVKPPLLWLMDDAKVSGGCLFKKERMCVHMNGTTRSDLKHCSFLDTRNKCQTDYVNFEHKSL